MTNMTISNIDIINLYIGYADTEMNTKNTCRMFYNGNNGNNTYIVGKCFIFQ